MGVFDWAESPPQPEPEHANGHTNTHTNGHQSATTETTGYGAAALTAELDRVAAATPNRDRNERLNTAAFNVAQLVNAGHVGGGEAEQALTEAARRTGLADTEIAKTLQSAGHGAGRKPRRDVPHPDAADPTVPTPTVLRVDETPEFWQSRPALAHVRDFARARRVSPWSLLGVTLTRVVGQVPPHVVLPPLVGGHASLNLFVGIVGPSGGGKGATESAADDCITFTTPDVAETHPVGSGEAIAHTYMTRRKNPDTGQLDVAQHTSRALFTAAEVDTLAALRARQSSTLMPELRKAWMGERLGFTYVDPAKRLPVPKHQYRLCLTVGIQPERAGVLLDDVDGGTPQRFLWVPAADPDAPEQRPDEPLGWVWQPPGWGLANSGKTVLEVCDQARRDIDADHLERTRGGVDALDGHAMLARLKVAAALALLDQRGRVDEQDWQLASVVMRASTACRETVQTRLSAAARQRNEAQGRAEAQRAAIVDEARDEAAVKRVRRVLLRRLDTADGEFITEGVLRRAVTSRDRSYYTDALVRLVDDGLVEREHGRQSFQYRRA